MQFNALYFLILEYFLVLRYIYESRKIHLYYISRPNSPAPLTDDWKVTDDSSVNFHDVCFFIFYNNLAKIEEKHIMEIYG